MSKLAMNPSYELYERSGHALCSSQQVAETFGKEDKNVLRDVENLDCSPEFHQLNFEPIFYLTT